MTVTDVRNAYTRRADDYVAAVGFIEAAHQDDIALVRKWSGSLPGPVIDAGCGPGHWTNFLCEQRVDAEGVDLVPAFLKHAEERYPGVPFRLGSLQALGVPSASLGGILAWYSLIHMPPRDLDAAFLEFARCIKQGGGLLVGFFEGPRFESFPHSVHPANFWPIAELCERLESTGFEVLETHTRTDEGHRSHGAIIARLPG